MTLNQIRYTIKHFFQRRIRGWDDKETWYIPTALAKWIVPRLKRFKEITNCYPPDLTEEKWDAILDEMIDGFELISDEDALYAFENKEEADRIWDKVQHTMDLFHQYYNHLGW